jgi:hypothetical protein
MAARFLLAPLAVAKVSHTVLQVPSASQGTDTGRHLLLLSLYSDCCAVAALRDVAKG